MRKENALRNTELIESVFARFMLPTMAAGASANIAGMIDSAVVGNVIGSTALAAVNVCKPALQVYGFLSQVLVSGLAACIALAVSRSEKKEADRTFTAGMTAGAALALILTVLQLAFSGEICRIFANDSMLYPLTLGYYRIFLFSVFFILLSEPAAAAMRTDGFPLLSALVLLLPQLINTGLDLLFVGVLKWGVEGAALATLLGYACGFLAACYYLFFRKTYRFDFSDLRNRILAITAAGAPPAVNVGLIAVKLILVNCLIVSAGGAVGMAVMSVLMVAWAIQSLFVGGVVQTVLPMFSYYYADGDFHGVRAVFTHALKVLGMLLLGLTVFLELFPLALPCLFGLRDAAELAAAVPAIRIFALFLPMEAFIMLMIVYYTATENRRIAAVLSVIQGLAAMVPVVCLFSRLFGLIGIWLAFPVSSLIPLAMILIQAKGGPEQFFRMKGETYLKEFSIRMEELAQTVDSVRTAVEKAGFDSGTAMRTGLSVEEMAVSAFERNRGRKLHIDVTVRKTGDRVLVTFSDDGAGFDPLRHLEEEDRSDSGNDGALRGDFGNTAVLKAISEKMEYAKVAGFNKTNIILGRRGENHE